MTLAAVHARIAATIPTMEGWCSQDKARAMADLIFEAQPEVCVEIGVFGGRSLLAMAIACSDTGKGHVYGIDPWSADEALRDVQEKENLDWWSKVDYNKIYAGCLRAILDHGLSPVCTVIRTTSEKASYLFDEIDILHIDGNHSEAASTKDVFLWLPKVVPGGYIWFDDIDWASTANAQRLIGERCEKLREVGTCALYRKK